MIKPQTLYNFGKVCKSDARAGRVLRALCGQEVALDDSEAEWADAIRNDSEWMEERIDEKREKDRKRQKEWRENHALSRDVTVTNCDSALSRAIHPSIPPSIHPSLQESTNRSVPVNAPARTRTRENGTERNENGTADTIIGGGGLDEARRLARQFKAALDADQSAFFDPEHDAVTICAALTGDYRSLNRWRQLVKAKGEDAVREEAFAFWREIRAGEDVANRGATLNRRLGDLADAKKSEGAKS